MENKIRVWDQQVEYCAECNLYCSEYDCNLIGFFRSVSEVNRLKTIHPDCPFAKPLSKEDIESCGFEINNGVSDNYRQNYEMCGIHGKQRGTFGVTIYDINKLSVYIYDGIREYILFTGIVNNLQEFKLLLKQLNIE